MGLNSFWAPSYHGDWGDSVLSEPQVPRRLAGRSSFSPPSTLGTGGTQSFQPPGTLGTVGTQSFQAPRYPWDWRDSVLSGSQLPLLGLAGLSPFRLPDTLAGTGETQSFQPPNYHGDVVLQKNWYWRVI